MSLQGKTISGLFWTVVDTFVLRGLTFLATIILARWLGPAEFGLIGMIAVFVALGMTIMDSGMSASLIRMESPKDIDYSTVFLLNLGLSVGFYLIIFFSSPYISLFYNQQILTLLIRIYGLSFIIGALSSVQLAILNGQMQFKQIMKLNMLGTIVGVSLGLTLGYLQYGVWSIVYMYLTTQLIQTITIWIKSKWKPAFNFSKSSAIYHFGFGYKLMLSGLLNTVFQNIYNIIIGKFYTVKELGYFERSKSFSDYPVSVLTTVLTKVTYPLLASIQSDQVRISRVYRLIMRLTFFITCPLMLSAAAIAKPLFLAVLGDDWLPAVPYFQLLCLSSIFYPIHAFNLNVFKVYGRSELFLKLEIIKKLLIILGLIFGFQFGIMGLVWSSVICNYIALYINTYYSGDMIHYSSKLQFLDMVPTMITAGITFFVVNFMVNNMTYLNNTALLVIGIPLSVLIYIGLNYIIKAKPLMYGVSIIKERKFKIQ